MATGERGRGGPVALLAVTMLGLVATGLPVSVLPVAVPELAAELDLTPSQVTLLLSGSQLAFALSIPLAATVATTALEVPSPAGPRPREDPV